ncbi:MAG: 50S ribosomal protein L13 [Parcubacteria group bacterium]|jgi:large subunit ribosomal protein L13
MNSKQPKDSRKYFLFDCDDFILGRMSARAAFILQGKHKKDYLPNKDGGDFTVVVNTDKIRTTGGKKDKKMYHTFSGYPGGITSRKLKDKMERDSRQVVVESVYGMLPKNKLRNRMMKRLLVFKDKEHGIKEKLEKITN